MHGEALLVVLVLVVGCAAFFFGVLYLLGRMLSCLGRGVWRMFRPCRRVGRTGRVAGPSKPRVCPNRTCRRIEYRPARYCSQCGTLLDVPRSTDA